MNARYLLFLSMLVSHAALQAQETTHVQDSVAVHADSSQETTAWTAQTSLRADDIARMPVFNRATGFTDMLTRTTPGVAADANGFAHPLGEHADTSISLDGQPITDQQAKVFSNQIDTNIIQDLTATTGAPPAEFGDKTSLVVTITTKSGQGKKLSGVFASDYGSFGTWAGSVSAGAGTSRWGEFFALSVHGSGRYLDTPEFQPIHARGNGASFFNRVDWQPDEADLLHLNVGAGRSWFQTPNSYDADAVQQDQRSQIRNVNLAVGWTHIFTPTFLTVFTPFYRHDHAEYFPSPNPLVDATATLAQDRTLTNTGFRLDGAFASGRHNARVGGTYWHTLLDERFGIGLTDTLYNAACDDAEGNAVAAPGVGSAAACSAAGWSGNAAFVPALLPFDLTRGGALFHFTGEADIAEAALYARDDIRMGRWLLSAGLRYDIYNGLSRGRQLQPRLGLSWDAPLIHTVLHASYARLYETPYNENLVFANESTTRTAANPFASFRSEPVRPGTRNQFNTGLQQTLGDHLTVSADYYWKFTQGDFDFSTLFNTPITFSVAWKRSKIDGFAISVRLTDWKGLTVSSVMGHTRSRFFTPQVGGLIFSSVPDVPVFRIDHGEEFEQTTDIRYRLLPRGLGRHQVFVSGTWRYNSGLALPNTVPTYLDALALTADQQAQMGLRCASDSATPTHAITQCSRADFQSDRVRIPSFGTEDEDRNPVRVAPRTTVDFTVRDDQLVRLEHATVSLHAGVMNATNRVSLYNFLSAFSGTHFVAPRSLQAGLEVIF